MIKKNIAYASAVLSMLALSSTAEAQEVTRTIEFSGQVSGVYEALSGKDITEFQITLGVDDTVTPSSSSSTSINHSSNGYLQTLDLVFFDSQGVEVEQPFDSSYESAPYSSLTYYADTNNEYISFNFEIAGGDGHFSISFSAPVGGLFSSFSPEPMLLAEPTQAQFSSHLDLYSPYAHDDAYGSLLSVNTIYPDDDEDGYPNNVDACPVSIMDETVLFDGWYDSGVTNHMDDSGCSITDHYAACEAEEQEAPRRGIRSVRSGPSSCEKAVSYDLVADGVISYAEARALREALYESSTSSGLR
ncbi:hypothetical protein CWE21_02995 [Pseudidiomarina aquimaris]|uniref:EF-hand domain-containing protein n=1 Tax=Pseudidiomarina aquimaris TaxID=641841 RepID=A0A432XN37_9GAMM|nr:hypothetical protein [Pseudidiomarina aquimaris]RUO50107.1 hypothetical protein CWE21_02995 [Pseudidiomarina aquimaris]